MKNREEKNIYLRNIHRLLLVFLFFIISISTVFISTFSYSAPPSPYSDPVGYPLAWPGSLTTYTNQGLPLIDPDVGTDQSYNTNPTPSGIDFSSVRV